MKSVIDCYIEELNLYNYINCIPAESLIITTFAGSSFGTSYQRITFCSLRV